MEGLFVESRGTRCMVRGVRIGGRVSVVSRYLLMREGTFFSSGTLYFPVCVRWFVSFIGLNRCLEVNDYLGLFCLYTPLRRLW